MIDYTKLMINQEDLDFLLDLRKTLLEDQCPIELICNGYAFQIDPGAGGAEIWHLGEKVAEYTSIDDLFFNFKIKGKSFIEQLAEIDYA